MRKENQGIRDAGQISRVPGFFVVHFSFFVVPGRGVLHTPHKTTRQGRSYLSIGRHIYPCGIHVGRMQYAPTLPAGDVSYLYPQRLPRTRHFLLLDLPFSMSPCRGVLNTPHKRPDRGGFKTIGRAKFLPFGAYNMEGGGRCPLTPTSFSCLDARKGCEKKIKASGMPANLAGYPTLSFLVFHFLIYLPHMIQIEDTIVSLDVIERRFMCDLSQCRGACCIEGESGAPLEEGEAEQLRLALPVVWDELKEDAREVIRQQGVSYLDADGDEVTSIVNGRDCVFTRYAPDGTCHCALEQAFREGRTTFMKPISCRLYPVRITQYRRFRAVNLHRWEVCRPAEILGERLGIPAYRFLREPLISKFGTEWYTALEAAAEMVARQSEQK